MTTIILSPPSQRPFVFSLADNGTVSYPATWSGPLPRMPTVCIDNMMRYNQCCGQTGAVPFFVVGRMTKHQQQNEPAAVLEESGDASSGRQFTLVAVGKPHIPCLLLHNAQTEMAAVSRFHLALTKDEQGVCRVMDLKSTYGTIFICGKSKRSFLIPPMVPIKLENGDAIVPGGHGAEGLPLETIFRTMYVITFHRHNRKCAAAADAPAPQKCPSDSTATGATRSEQKLDDDELLNEIKDAVQCPCCYDIPLNIRVLPCGHTACFDCLHVWMVSHDTCPVCRFKCDEPCVKSRGLPSVPLSNIIKMHVEKSSDGQFRKQFAQYQAHLRIPNLIKEAQKRAEIENENQDALARAVLKRRRAE
jgi:hypothetical protein